MNYHMGRSWTGHPLEDDCPCGKAPCGLVDSDKIDADCLQHGIQHARTMRQMFRADECRPCKELEEESW